MASKSGGKWSSHRGDLPAAPVEEKNAAKVNRAADEYRTLDDAAAWMREIASLEEEKDRLEATVSDINVRLEALSRLMLAKLEALDTSSLKNAVLGRTFYRQDEPYPQVVDKDAVNEWYEQQNMGHVRQVPWPSLKAEIKRQLEEGEAFVPGVKVYLKSSVRSRKS